MAAIVTTQTGCFTVAGASIGAATHGWKPVTHVEVGDVVVARDARGETLANGRYVGWVAQGGDEYARVETKAGEVRVPTRDVAKAWVRRNYLGTGLGIGAAIDGTIVLTVGLIFLGAIVSFTSRSDLWGFP